MLARALALVQIFSLSGAVAADKWTEYHYGPFTVVSSAGDKQAKEAMNRLEQFRWAFGQAIGKPDLASRWPITVVVSKKPVGTPARFGLSREGYISEGLSAGALADLANIFLDANTAPLPEKIERPLIDLYAAIAIDGTHVTLGAGPAEASRIDKDWARVNLLSTDPRYSGRMRVFLYNLQQTADPEPAYKNAFETNEAKVDAEAAAALAAGKFGTIDVNAKAVHADRDFLGKPYDPAKAALINADLWLGAGREAAARARQEYAAVNAAGAKDGIALATLDAADLKAAVDGGSANTRVWFEYGSRLKDADKARAAFVQAAKLNPKWSMPQYGLAQLESDPKRKAFYLAAAAKLEPRNLPLLEALATAYTESDQFTEASKAWALAEKAARTPADRERMRQLRASITDKRLDQEAAERRRIAEAKERELNKLRDEAMARIHKAEAKANSSNTPLDPKTPVVAYAEIYSGTPKVSGVLLRVDCMGKRKRLAVRQQDHSIMQVMVSEPAKAAIKGKLPHTLACGTQRVPRRMTAEYRDQPDLELSSFGEVVTIEFQ
jgi:hypothetical protein